MKLERLGDEAIPDDLSEHWQRLQDTTGPGRLQSDIGMKDEHQRVRHDRVLEITAKFAGHAEACLEIGCCEGVMTARLAEMFSSVLAVDFVQSLLDACPQIPNVEYVLADVQTWEPPGSFDVVVISEVLEHLRDPVAVLRRLAEHTRVIVASCPVNEELQPDTAWSVEAVDRMMHGGQAGIGDGAGHLWAMDMDGFTSMFTSAELRILHSEIVFPSAVIVAEGAVG